MGIVRAGLVSGLILCALMFGPTVVFGPRVEWMSWGEIYGYTGMILCMTATFFAMRQERQRRGGTLSFGAALAVGAGVSVVGALVFGLATWLFYIAMGDALPEAILAFYQEQIRESGAEAEVIRAQLDQMEQMRPFMYNRPLQALVMFATVFLIGIVESVLGALIVKRT